MKSSPHQDPTFRRRSLCVAASIAAALFTSIAITPTLAAQTADHREATSPTSWIVRSNQSIADIQTNANNGWRAVDLDVTATSPTRMTVTYVRNTGAYRSSSWWFHVGKTRSELQALMISSRRPICIHPYSTSSGIRYAALFITNTGTNAKTYYYYTRSTLSYLDQRTSANNARIVDYDSFVDGNTRYHTAIAIKNTGADARAWYLASGLSTSQISSTGSSRNMQTYDLVRRSDGRYNVLYTRRPSTTSLWWYSGRSLSQLEAIRKQNGARIYEVEPYLVGRTRYYAALMIQNANDLTVRVGRALRAATDGDRGFVLERVNGSRLAGLMTDFKFDPASTLKQLHAVYALRRVRTNASITLNSTIAFRDGPCPYSSGSLILQPLTSLLRDVLEDSDNRRTDAIERWAGGKSAFHSFANSIGMSDTRSNRVMGCSAPPYNSMTMNDLVAMHDRVPTLLGTDLREVLIDRMLNSRSNFPGTGGRNLNALLTSERSRAGLTTAEYNGFLSSLRLAYKPGSKTIGGRTHRTTSGLAILPFISNNSVQLRDYVFGAFAHGASNSTNAANAISNAAHELLRDRIRAAMSTWKGYQGGSYTEFGSSCNIGSLSFEHSATGTPAIGYTTTWRLSRAAPRYPAIFWIGSSRTAWNGLGLPLSLTGLGAPGCFLRVAPVTNLATAVSSFGTAAIAIPIPRDSGLVGQRVYTQFGVFIPRTNALGLRTSNGVDMRIGGSK